MSWTNSKNVLNRAAHKRPRRLRRLAITLVAMAAAWGAAKLCVNKLLCNAVYYNDLAAAKRYLALGGNPNQQIDTLLQSHSVNGYLDRIRNWDRFKVPLLSVSLDTWNAGYARFDIARALVLAGADPNALDWIGRTPLELAVLNDNKEMASFLLDHGARVNGLNGDGETALCNALMNGLGTEVRLLLERGANPNGPCGDKGTTLSLAKENCSAQTVALLRKHIGINKKR